MRSTWVHGVGVASVVALVAPACGSASNGASFAPGAGFDNGADASATPSGSSGASGGSSSGGGTTADAGPPEKKVEDSYQSPVSTGQYVWITNPSSGLVAYIQASTLQVSTVAAGDGPTYLAAVPTSTGDAAIVLNVLSHDATLMRASGGKLATSTFPVAPDVNAWAVSADGRWALAWGDATRASNPDPTEGFQDVSALDLTGKAPPTTVSVGYRPVELAFAADASRAFAVTQDGISVIDLTGSVPLVTRNFAISDQAGGGATADAGGGDASGSGSDGGESDAGSDGGAEIEAGGTGGEGSAAPSDVSITPDGSYALVRRDGDPVITVVALSDGTLTDVVLPADATDLALSPAGDRALAVMRTASTVAILPIPGIATAPTSFSTVAIPGQTFGRAIVADDATTTLLFTTVLPVDTMTVLDLSSRTFHTAPLHLPIYAVFPTHDAQYALVLHSLPPDAGTSAKGAFSVLPVGAQLPAKLVGTQAPPNAVALSPSSDRLLVTVRDDDAGVYGAYLARMPSLEIDRYALASPPIAAGVVAGANVAYVAQSNPEGRITFIDLATGQARTLTGFELGSRVVDGSQP